MKKIYMVLIGLIWAEVCSHASSAALSSHTRPALRSLGLKTGLHQLSSSRLGVSVTPVLTWEEQYEEKTVTEKVLLAPLALVRILTKPGRDAISWIDKELPMIQFLWPKDDLRLRSFLVASLMFMIMGKWVNVQVPFIMQSAIDAISLMGKEKLVGEAKVAAVIPQAIKPMVLALTDATGQTSLPAVGSLLLLFYGIAKALSVVFAEIKTSFFAHVSQSVLRKFANQIFAHLHSLDSEFFTATPSGVISQAYARAVRGFQTMLFQIVFSITPTMIELVMVCSVLYKRLGGIFSLVTLGTSLLLAAFVAFLVLVRCYLCCRYTP